MPTNPPPILILMTDQQRADGMGCAGSSGAENAHLLQTPNMDRLASEGVRFSRATTVSPVCMPARASFVSGLYPHNHGMWTNHGELPADDETFFHHLQRAGYHVAYVGKSHFYSHGHGLHLREREPYMRRRGIDTIFEATGPYATQNTGSFVTDHWESKGIWQAYRDDYRKRSEAGAWKEGWPSPHSEEDFLDSVIGRKAVEVIDAYDGDAPLCLFVGFGGPHRPFDPPGRYARMYDPADCPVGAPPEPLPAAMPEHARERIRRGRTDEPDPDDARRIHALYYGKISLLDNWFGEVMAAYARRGWLDDSLVVHWSDHGEMLCDHGRLAKSVFYAGALDIAMTLRWPGHFDGGRVSPALVETIDVFPTLLEAVGCEVSARCMGRSMWPVLKGETDSLRDAAFSEVGDTSMVRTDRWKYATDSQGRGYMLFDLQNDPQEQSNLIGAPGTEDIERTMRERLLQFLLATQVRQ